MDIFVQNLPPGATDKHIENHLKGPLAHCGINTFHVKRLRDRSLATITVLETVHGQKFLDLYGAFGTKAAKLKLHWDGKYLRCTRSKNEPSDISIRALRHEATQNKPSSKTKPSNDQDDRNKNAFDIDCVFCGIWACKGDSRASNQRLVYVPYFQRATQGRIVIGAKGVMIIMEEQAKQYRIDINYHHCKSIVVGSRDDPSVTFDLPFAPRTYEGGNGAKDIVKFLEQLNVSLPPIPVQSKKVRLPAISKAHAAVAGTCFVYRVRLAGNHALTKVYSLLTAYVKSCSVKGIKTSCIPPRESRQDTSARLNHQLTDVNQLGKQPFSLRFQLSRLAMNGIMSPSQVIELLTPVIDLVGSEGLEPVLYGIRRLSRTVQLAGPDTDLEDISTAGLLTMLKRLIDEYDPSAPDNPYVINKRYRHVNLIQRVVVTPTGTYLEGPEPEPTNRVLRIYEDHLEHFIRVVFLDEDGSPLTYDARTDLSRIYQGYRSVMDSGIVIAGRRFSFLGFSHSSLRNRSCWFMAPMYRNNELLLAENVIKRLGNFSEIYVPAKCAARIGQNFTDTNATVDLNKDIVGELPVIRRNNRDFSDGVGTISMDLLRRVWKVYGQRRRVKPTVLQIRFQGSKGMVSLDTTLQGEKLMLRSNMKKYETQVSWNLEICGAAFRPLPMVLNRQFVKILEDLKVAPDSFMELQAQAVQSLRRWTSNPIDTAEFLDSVDISGASRLPSLIEGFGYIGLDYHNDDFLYGVVEMAITCKLRDIKYRGRIPVENGVTLYGIMDETGFLNEGEIYVVFKDEQDGRKRVIEQSEVIVTRSPAMHPGDIQLARAVQIPDSSPLRELSNVIVFSQYGSRDLPSQLSGGDLDGDLYNVIWDSRLLPKITYVAADYPRVEAINLERPVTSKDMSDFFVRFMESDQLGMIANRHLQLADQRPSGTLDPGCLTLANMASTAVDFSKTGVSVDMTQLPKCDPCKPDFMAPSPRILVSESGYLGFNEEEDGFDDTLEGWDMEKRPTRYYRSDKVLGCLYRAIDEHQFLNTMQKEHLARPEGAKDEGSIMHQFLSYMKHQFGMLYSHHEDFARNIRSGYEESIADILYNYSPSPAAPISETEAFAGNILGRQGGAQGKPLRDLSATMRERLGTIIDYTEARIIKGDQIMTGTDDLDELYNEREVEALPRAIACLQIALTTKGYKDRQLGEMKSFRYVAASVCLQELRRFLITTIGSHAKMPAI